MDDSCAVCAETLEWVAYGPCGHREVCSTCVARLRFICDDRRCCICKTESDVVFVTKALGDYTRVISDFSVLPSERREGRVGSYWYHEDTQSLFDDLDHYKMIKAMCRLSCSECDKMEENPTDGSKRRARFRNIEQLKGHLFHQHRLLMCSLCLEGRKVFICEQKLYTRAQLNRHISTGDSEVDGTERERGGFMGHPMCEFCRTPFYGDNELYSHMTTDHYTCHICQRQHPGQYEYYKNYDDLEIHFGREHFLCEDEACLAKKFVVFQSESEMKRHNAMEHGGHMSRSQRNAALQIPTSFRYQQSNEHDNRRGRGRTFRRDYSGDQLSMAIQASLETANEDGTFHGPSSSSTQIVSDHGVTSNIDPIVQPFESLATTDSEPPSRYRQALSQNSSNAPLEESSFPPLPLAPSGSQQKSKHLPGGLPRNTMAVQMSRNVPLEGSSFPTFPLAPSSSRAKAKHEPEGLSRNTMAAQKPRNAPLEGSSFPPLPLAPSSSQPKAKHEPEGLPRNTTAAQKSKNAPLEESSFPPLPLAPGSSQQKSKHEPEGLPRNAMAAHLRHQNNRNVTLPNAAQAWSAASCAPVLPATGPIYTRPIANGAPGLSSSSGRNKSATDNGPEPSTYLSLVQVQPSSVHEASPDGTSNSSREMGRTSRISHSTSAPNLTHSSFDPSTANFPPVSATQTRKLTSSASTGQDTLKVEDVHTANKSLVERIRSALEFNEAKYNAFKEISGEYRLGSLDAGSYLAYAEQFGLSHLVIELARLCPDAEKQKALLEAYNATLNSNTSQENGWSKGRTHIKDSSGCKKGKGKCLDAEGNSSTDNLTDSILSTVRKLQSTYRPSEEDVEVLSRDGYRSAQAEMSSSSESSLKLKGENNSHSAGDDGSNKKAEDSGGKSKQRKKTSKFHRVRLGDGSVAALLDPNSTDPDTDPYSDAKEATSDANKNPIEGLPVRGVWRQGGGQRLLGMTARDPQK